MSIFVGNIPESLTEKDIEKLFKKQDEFKVNFYVIYI